MTNAPPYYPTYLHKKTAITLVVHGLNVQPLAMLPLVQWLNSQGSDVYLLALAGHYEGATSINDVTASKWQQEMQVGYNAAKSASQTLLLPLYFLGFSLGALLGQSMIALDQKPPAFDKQVLLAPATALRKRSRLIKLLFFLGDRFQLPSYTPKGYRFNKKLPLRIYHILLFEERKVMQAQFNGLNMPTLIVMDPKDELISYERLVTHIKKYRLTHYQCIALNSDLKNRETNYHHLILNERTMGAANWELVTSSMKAFLFE